MALTLYDTLTRAERPFEPREAGKASMYVCGPTVQGEAHIGHGRAAVVFDVLRRYLIWSGYQVTAVQNVTDIDDKIILRARREGLDPAVISTRYTRAWNRTMDALGVLPPDVQPLATGHLIEMQDLIRRLVEQGKAYASGGDVFFRVRTFEGYGKLSRRRLDDMQQGEDVVDADHKEDPLDFALWKAAKPGEPAWGSPWGPGRPGWHIECSAMAAKHLGHGFDIHGGGLDLVFPHHENEIAQHEAAHGGTFARYWVHNGMVQMGTEKMSKSVGNVVSLADALEEWGVGPLRLWYLSAQHRTPLTFETDRLRDATTVHQRFVTFLRSARRALDGAGAEVVADPAAATPHLDAFRAALDADLNAPAAVAALHELVTAGNERLPAAEKGDAAALAAVAALADALVEVADDVLGLHLTDALQDAAGVERHLEALVDSLLDQRAAARAARDFAAADAIRDQLTAAGVVVEDRPDGPRWYVATTRPQQPVTAASDADASAASA
ncbi:MAG: cysteine--tRNA ligase [Nitriliruptoraceae bacterium]